MILCASCSMPYCRVCAENGRGLKLTGRYNYHNACMTEGFCNPPSAHCQKQRKKRR